MATIMVTRDLGDRIVTREHGRRLREIVESFPASSTIVIDFEGLQVTSVSFFDEAFGILARDKGAAVMSHIQFEHMDPFDRALLLDIIRSRSEESRRRTGRS